MVDEKYYSIREVARLLSKSETTIMRYCRDKKLGALKVGNAWRIPQKELDKFLSFPVGAEVQD